MVEFIRPEKVITSVDLLSIGVLFYILYKLTGDIPSKNDKEKQKITTYTMRSCMFFLQIPQKSTMFQETLTLTKLTHADKYFVAQVKNRMQQFQTTKQYI